jgi:hypothetical protein
MVEYQSIKLISQWLIPNFDLTMAFGGATMEWFTILNFGNSVVDQEAPRSYYYPIYPISIKINRTEKAQRLQALTTDCPVCPVCLFVFHTFRANHKIQRYVTSKQDSYGSPKNQVESGTYRVQLI